MILYVVNQSLEITDIFETYRSIIWTTRYFEAGDFEIYTPATAKFINALQIDSLIIRDDDMEHAMVVEKVQIQTDVEAGNYLIVTGRCLKSILTRRIVWSQTSVSGRVEDCIRQLISQNAIAPTDNARKISNLVLGDSLGASYTMSAQYTGDNLYDTVVAICKSYGLGFDILVDMDSKNLKFVLLQGADRSYNQDANPHVIFSPEYENLLTSNYYSDKTEYKNVAKVAGEGEGSARKTFISGISDASGLARYEIFVDARDISTNDGEIALSDYNLLLDAKGVEALSETVITESIDGEVAPDYNYTFGVDYFLGDIVEVVNEYGISMAPRITEVIESEDDTGHFVIPTFSTETD